MSHIRVEVLVQRQSATGMSYEEIQNPCLRQCRQVPHHLVGYEVKAARKRAQWKFYLLYHILLYSLWIVLYLSDNQGTKVIIILLLWYYYNANIGKFNHLRNSLPCYLLPRKIFFFRRRKKRRKIVSKKFGGFKIMMYFCIRKQALRVAQLRHTNRVSHRDNHGGKRMCKCLTT